MKFYNRETEIKLLNDNELLSQVLSIFKILCDRRNLFISSSMRKPPEAGNVKNFSCIVFFVWQASRLHSILFRRAGSQHSIFFAFEPRVFFGRRLNAAAPSKKRAAQRHFIFLLFLFFVN